MVNQALGIVNLPWVDSALSNTLQVRLNSGREGGQ